MTYIDFDKLKRERTEDIFAFSPIDIRESVQLMAEIVRDKTRQHAEASKAVGEGISRVEVAYPSPRLRQRLAILGWLPVDPATDDAWYLDEPVELSPSDNHVVAAFVAQSYADDMNLLFAPDDGLFSGAAVVPFPGNDVSRAAVGAYQRSMVERAYVASAVICPSVPPTILAFGAATAIERANQGRRRLGLAAITVPSRSTVGRWQPEIKSRHATRPGIGAEWRSYEYTQAPYRSSTCRLPEP